MAVLVLTRLLGSMAATRVFNDLVVAGISRYERLAWSAARVSGLLNRRDLELGVEETEAVVVGAAAGSRDVAVLAEHIGRRLTSA